MALFDKHATTEQAELAELANFRNKEIRLCCKWKVDASERRRLSWRLDILEGSELHDRLVEEET